MTPNVSKHSRASGRRLRGVLVGSVVVLLGGCAVGPRYHTPKLPVPGAFAAVSAGAPGQTAASATSATAGTLVASRGAEDLASWWHALDDAQLDSLVERAVKSNPDVRIALDRLQAARTYEVGTIGTALPDVEASAGGGRGTGSDLSRGRAAQPLTSADNSTGLKHISEVGGFDSVWELDLFGRVRREIQAARYNAEAAAAARDAVLVAVISDVARAYIDLRGLQVKAAVLHAASDTLRESLRIVRIRYERGITNELDVTLATRELATLEAQIAPVEAQINAAQYTIATLLGEYPEKLGGELAQAAMIPAVPTSIDPGIPVDLLERRPDIRESERELGAATAGIGIATANLFPRLIATGAIGFQRDGLGTAGTTAEHIWSAGAGALWPLLDFGSLDAQVQIATLRTRAQLVDYERTIQRAVQEVDTASVQYSAQQSRLAKLSDALVASRRAVTLATERYDRGLTDFLNVVDAQREEYDIEEQYTDAQVAADEQFVALYRSLGGGWQNYQQVPGIRHPLPAVVAAFRAVLTRNDESRDVTDAEASE